MDRFLSIEAFVRVAQAQSFAEAARQLRLSKSVVTARVQQLEDLLGGPLFHRTTRAVRLSEMGQAFFRDCHELVSRTNEIVDQMREVRGSPAGLLRVHALTGFVLGHMAHLLRDFQERYPEVLLDLFGHRLGLYSGYPTRDRWVFHHDGADAVTVELKPTLMSNSVHLLRDYGCEHAGLVCLPTLVAGDAIQQGQLQVVLGDYQLSSFWLSAVYPRTQLGAFKPKLFIETLAHAFAGGEPPWDRDLIARGLMPGRLIEP
jgi:DNA-binding transcriptional LysR family regulator